MGEANRKKIFKLNGGHLPIRFVNRHKEAIH
jgi:hypothetical protein